MLGFSDEDKKLYPRISEEEIVALYATDGIPYDPLREINKLISEKVKQLRNEKEPHEAENRLLRALFGEDTLTKVKQEFEIHEDKIKTLKQIHEELGESSEYFDYAYNVLCYDIWEYDYSDILKDLELKLEPLKKEYEKEVYYSEENIAKRKSKLRDEIDALEEKKEKILKKQGNHIDKMYKATTKGQVEYKKFPSRETRNKIVEGCLGQAEYYAKVYYYKADKQVPLEELFQIACEGLISAAQYYVPGGTAKFATYSKKCIENKLRREIWTKKKRKKSPHNSTSFFENESDKIKYMLMFFSASTTINGHFYPDFYKRDDIKNLVKKHNRKMKEVGEVHRLLFLPQKDKKDNYSQIRQLLKMYTNFLKQSKINLLITEEERDLINLQVSYLMNIPANSIKMYELYYTILLYKEKLELIEAYINTEEELEKENNGITPTRDEILKKLNSDIEEFNKEFYRQKKTKERPHLDRLYCHYYEYMEEYNVDFFLKHEDYIENLENQEDRFNKAKERIINDYYNYYLKNTEDEIKKTEEEYTTPRFKVAELEIKRRSRTQEKIDIEEVDYPNYLKTTNDELPLSKDKFLEAELCRRSINIKKILEIKNTSIIEHNKSILKQVEIRENSKYKKYLKESDMATIEHNIDVLYDENPELIFLARKKSNKESRQITLSAEDEALNNLFLEDYYNFLNTLPSIDRDIMLMYFDSNGKHSMTAKEIRASLDKQLSVSQIYKKKDKVLTLLRNNPVISAYKDMD